MKHLEDPARDDRPSDYSDALRMHDKIESAYLAAVAEHRAVCGTNRLPNGLTPDHVKASPEWKATRARMDRAQRILAEFNQTFLKNYKREWKQTLAERRANRQTTNP